MRRLNVLVACEESGVVRSAFRALGHNAWSCDMMLARDSGPHLLCENDLHIFEHIESWKWDVILAFPPCDYLTVSGNRWFSDTAIAAPGVLTGADRREAQEIAVRFVKALWESGDHVVIENPIGRLSTLWRKPTQVIRPSDFGHPEFKQTCLWAKNLPKLQATNILTPPLKGTQEHKEWSKVHRMPPGPNRRRDRSTTYPGIAHAFADQYSKYLLSL